MKAALQRIATIALAFVLSLPGTAAEIVLPQNRTAFFTAEPIEIAVADLDDNEKVLVELKPQDKVAMAVSFQVKGDGGTVCLSLSAGSLAPGQYDVFLGGVKQRQTITVSRGVHSSTFYVSQTINERQLEESAGNFAVSNAFSFGILDQGRASENLRRMSPGMQAQDRLIGADVPSLIYMYYTGYVLHKPWGVNKSWAAEHMTEAMRLFNFHVAQRLRRFGPNILSVGTIDEPGLSWGETPAGDSASGYPAWDEALWYEARGWRFANDPASRPDDDWLKYAAIRTSILGEQNTVAKKDLQQVWPDVVFSTDLYAPHAMMDGTDPWNQTVNDIPSTHVFLDWGGGKLSVIGGMYLEKAHDPTAKVAHAMNGQLFGKRVPQPQMRYAYHLMLNSMMAAGLRSNWWLNFGGMTAEDLTAVNEPAQRLGPLFIEMSPSDHDTALLWSFTEIAMRLKDITRKEATKKTGEQIKLMVADMPENAVSDKGELDINAYSVGTNYKSQVLNMHQALNRAGYPAHIVHERLLPQGILKNYKTLVIIGQTFDMPDDVQEAIDQFVAGGGKLVVDDTTTVEFPDAVTAQADLKDAGYRWNLGFVLKEDQFKTKRDASYAQTNHFMDSFARNVVPEIKEAMAKTGSQPVIRADTTWLGCERHVAGEGEMHLVINAHEQLPTLADDAQYYIYNYAPYETTVRLNRIAPGRVVYAIEGLDWSRVTPVAGPNEPQTLRFEPGEMKVFLVAPRRPEGIDLSLATAGHSLRVMATLKNLKMPWPFTLRVTDPAGEEIIRIHRATGDDGLYQETLPIGANALAGDYSVETHSSVADLKALSTIRIVPSGPTPQPVPSVRVFDGEAIKDFLAGKPQIIIALAAEEYRSLATDLAHSLRSKGIAVTVKPESVAWHKAAYPRVWDPYFDVYSPEPKDRSLDDREVKRRATIETIGYNHHRLQDESGNEVAGRWDEPGSLLTVTGRGCVIEAGGRLDAYEAGCKLYVDDRRRGEAVNGKPTKTKATPDVRARWGRPWHSLQHHVGGHHLVPQLPEAYRADEHLILLGDSRTSELVRAVQGSELLLQVADEKYPGPRGKALVSFVWSPFAVEKNVILIAATDAEGLRAGTDRLVDIVR